MLFNLHDAIDSTLFIKDYKNFLREDILFDTGPLFLYLIGSFDNKEGTELLKIFKYSLNDYHTLFKLIHLFKKSHKNFIVTPHIFHELIKHLQDDCKKIYQDQNKCKKVLLGLSSFLGPILQQIKEIHIEKDILVKHDHFLGKFEIGDISIHVVDKKTYNCSIILTDDKKMKAEYEDKDDNLVIYFPDIKYNSHLFN